MPQSKPVAYPNIVEQIKATVAAHDAIHGAVRTHVQQHHEMLEAQRKQLHVAHMAKKLIESDGKS